jgi:DNA (cytosine-5)-methyltransferase 1
MPSLLDHLRPLKISFGQTCNSIDCDISISGWPDIFGGNIRFLLSNTNYVNTISLFSGAGGLDIGFTDAGFNIIESVELEKIFCDTLIANQNERIVNEKQNIICNDIKFYNPTNINNVDFIIGGPPCQTFSAAGRRANGVLGITDSRGVLFTEYIRIVELLKPKGFLFENVYGIIGAEKGIPWQKITSDFKNIGYNLFYRILDAADYGVPQHRERLFIIGLLDNEFKFPYPTHGPDSVDKSNYYTAKLAIESLQSINNLNFGLNGRYGSLLDNIPPGLNYSFYTEEMGHPNPIFSWRSKFSDFLYKADPDSPVRTIKAQGGQYTGPFHWDNRRFTIDEYKRLQLFQIITF